MISPDIERLIQLLSKLPGLGPRSAKRATLALLKRPEGLLMPLARAMVDAGKRVVQCQSCGNLDTHDPCSLCANEKRNQGQICVVEDVADLWAMERTAAFKGQYHVLGGVLSALDGIGPEDLNIPRLLMRACEDTATEVVLATSATVDGQTTAHYITDRLQESGADVRISAIAHGVPVGGELDYLDDGTIAQAFKARGPV